MVSFSFTGSRRPPRTVVGGRLIEPQRSLSLQRFAATSLLLVLLFVSNRTLRIPSWRRTDFGLWSLSEPFSDRVRIHLATLSVDCPYAASSICVFLRDQLAHNKPTFYDKDDYPYSVHRCLCWTLFLTSLLGACWTRSTSHPTTSGVVVVDGFLDLVLLPIDSALSLIGLLSFFLYPTWLRMQTLILLQHQKSWFYDSFALSVGCLLLIAVLGNTISRTIWNTHAPRGCQLGTLAPAPAHALVAAMAGYYRGTFASDSLLATGPSYTWYGGSYYAPTTLSWMLLCVVIASAALKRRDYGIGLVISWVLTNMVAAMFGQYQQEQQVVPVLAKTVSNVWKEFWDSLIKI